MRMIPEAKALWQRVLAVREDKDTRRSAMRLLIAFGLMAPAAVMMAGERREAEQQARDRALAAQFEDPANAAWSDYILERELQYIAAGFAQRFNIPVRLAEQIHEAAREEGVDPAVAFGLVRAESSFRPRAVSPVGAVGLTQVLPSTGRWIVPGTTRADLMNPETNLRVGFRYLQYLVEKYDGDEKLALTAYNRGPGTVDRHLRQGRNPDNGYAEMVLTGTSKRHTQLMNARFGGRGRS
jgi:soluble lytic murein transglycosylase-like protein